jgi:hypothetical protein
MLWVWLRWAEGRYYRFKLSKVKTESLHVLELEALNIHVLYL